MPICSICKAEIPRGKGYKGDRFKSEHFCSEACYNERVKKSEKSKKSNKYKPAEGTIRRKLTDYIQQEFGENANWPLLMTQVKAIENDWGLDDKELLLVMRYAKEYEDYVTDTNYALYQFIKYIEPTREFIRAIERNKTMAKEMEDDEVMVIKKKPNTRVWRER